MTSQFLFAIIGKHVKNGAKNRHRKSVIFMLEPLAQLAEHLTFNQRVRSSNLRWLTTKTSQPLGWDVFIFYNIVAFFNKLQSVLSNVIINKKTEGVQL